MMKIEALLRELGLGYLIHSEFYPEIGLYEVQKGRVEDMYGYATGTAWYLARGSIKGRAYLEEEASLYWELTEGQWFGFVDAILGTMPTYDLEAMSDCEVLEIPVKKILESEDTSPELLKALMWHMAMSKRKDDEAALTRLGLSDEGFFLKYLENNDFHLRYRNQQEVSDLLHINPRTFQRILSSLDKNGILLKRRGCLEVVDKEKFYTYIEEKELWRGK